MKKLILLLILLFPLIISCKKRAVNHFTGKYSCTYYGHGWMLGEPSTDTSYETTLEVTRNKKELTVLGRTFHSDSIQNNKTYYGYSYKVRFYSKDSLYFYSWSGGLGGGSSSTYYCDK